MTALRGLDDDHTLTGRNHPGTSHIAAAAVLPKSGTTRRQAYDLIASSSEGLADVEIQRQLAMPANTQRPRRVELVNLGLIEDSLSRIWIDGSLHIRWRAV